MKNAKRQNLFKREKNFDKESLIAGIINIDWELIYVMPTYINVY